MCEVPGHYSFTNLAALKETPVRSDGKYAMLSSGSLVLRDKQQMVLLRTAAVLVHTHVLLGMPATTGFPEP